MMDNKCNIDAWNGPEGAKHLGIVPGDSFPNVS